MLFTRYLVRTVNAISGSYWMLPVIVILALALLAAGLRQVKSSFPRSLQKVDNVVTEREWI